MSQQVLLNQAVATIQGRMTDAGLVVGEIIINTALNWSYHRYVSKHSVSLPYDALFRVWPRTDKTGLLSEVTIIVPDPSVNDAVFSGTVVWSSETIVTLRVSPNCRHINPFLLTLLHDGSVQVKYGWAMRFICDFSYDDVKFHIKEAISLKHLLCSEDMAPDSTSALLTELDSDSKELIRV